MDTNTTPTTFSYRMIKPPLHHKLAIVDLETTGANPQYDRIIEIGVLLIDEGNLVHRWQQLIDPQQPLSHFIQQLTGINDAMLAGAPVFADIVDALQALLHDRIFVAHNARFDYGFLKAEFARRHITFAPDTLCTVRWSRSLYPQHKSHSLDAICARTGFANNNRHRALGDALATWDFLEKTTVEFDADTLHTAFVKQHTRPSLPPAITQQRMQSIPNSPGVYRFYGDDDVLLYIGKSARLRDRILSHFSDSPVVARHQRLHQLTRDISVETCCGELGALLKVTMAITQEAPLMHRKKRSVKTWYAITTKEDKRGYLCCKIQPWHGEPAASLALFRSRALAKAQLVKLSTEKQLCKKLLGLETAKTACLNVALDRCKGACCGLEPALHHNLRLQAALLPLQVRAWPFDGPIGLIERLDDKTEMHVMDAWCYLGTATDEEAIVTILEQPRQFDRAIYRLLQKALRRRVTLVSLQQRDSVSF